VQRDPRTHIANSVLRAGFRSFYPDWLDTLLKLLERRFGSRVSVCVEIWVVTSDLAIEQPFISSRRENGTFIEAALKERSGPRLQSVNNHAMTPLVLSLCVFYLPLCLPTQVASA
jgi:hypothetical protein